MGKAATRRKIQRKQEIEAAQIITRSISGVMGNPNDEDRSIDIVLATETPVTIRTERGEYEEILLMSGAEFASSVPMMDAHARSVRSVMGSLRNLRVEGDKLVCRAFFKESDRSTYEDYRDGHLTAFSVGARIPKGAIKRDGKKLLVTRWQVEEGSAVLRGADPNATVLSRSYEVPQSGEEKMDAALKALFVSRGMDPTLEGDKMQEWVEKNMPVTVSKEKAEEITRSAAPLVVEESAEDAIARSVAVSELCTKHKIDPTDFIKRKLTREQAASEILAKMTPAPSKPIGQSVEVTKDEGDKIFRAMEEGLSLRVGVADEKTEQHNPFRNRRMIDLARASCEVYGQDVRFLSDYEIAERSISLQRSDAFGYNTTGSLPNVVLNVTKKSLAKGYTEAPTTYQRWVSKAPSTNDFKPMTRVRMGELTYQPVVAENGIYDEQRTSDAKEQYSVEKRGSVFSYTLEMMLADDLNALSKIPMRQGASVKRTINRDVYAVLTTNAALSDGVTLFHADHANLGNAALASAGLAASRLRMRKQTGLDGVTLIDVEPRFLIVPAALEQTAKELMSLSVIPEANKLYGNTWQNSLELIIAPQLDASSATAYYLIADSSMIDTVELTFLQGHETPQLTREESFRVDAICHKVRTAYGVKALDHRGMDKGNT